MKTLKNKIPGKDLNIIIGSLVAVIGLFILLFPDKSLISVCYALGVCSLIGGAIRIANYVKDKKESIPNIIDIISGIVLLAVSFMLLLHPRFLTSILPFIMGVSIVVYGISAILSGKSRGLFSKITSVFIIIYGTSLIFNPFKGATSIVSMVGFGMLVFGIIKIVGEIIFNKVATLPDNTDTDGFIEVDYKDV